MGDVVAPHAQDEIRVPAFARRTLTIVVVTMVAAIVVGLVLLWPDPLHHRSADDAIAPDARYDAVVTTVDRGACDDAIASTTTCASAHVRLREGPDDGEVVALPQESDGRVHLDAGDEVVVGYYADAEAGLRYVYTDQQRRLPLLALVAVAAVIVVALGRRRGLGGLAAAAASVAVIAVFVLPAILDGRDPVLVALAGGGAIVVLAVYLRRGVNVGSTLAVAGSLVSLGLVGGLAWVVVGATHLTGRAAGDGALVQVASSDVRLRGIALAGIVIGALGVVADLAVRQVLAVWNVRGGDQPMTRAAVFRTAMRDGRDQVAASVTTLVLAYAGATLPVLLVLTESRQGLLDAANGETLAVEIVRTAVGAIGLAAAVPITTMLSTWAIGTSRPERRRDDPRVYRNRHERALWAGAAAAAPALPDRPDRAL